MSASERGGGAGGYLRDTKATVYHGGGLCLLVYMHQHLTYAVLIGDHWILTASRC